MIALSVLAGIILAPSGALAASPRQPTADSGRIGIRLVAVPGDSRGDPFAQSYIVERLAPGTVIQRRVEIGNSTGSTVDVPVYAAAASLVHGSFGFAASHIQNELSSWTSLSRPVLRLSPHTKTVETVTISVPADASPGEHYAVIWAQISKPAPAAGGVTLVNRVGVRMYLSIGPGGLPAANFAIGPLRAKRSTAGEPLVVATIRNTGGHTLEISGALTLSNGPAGLRAGPVPVTLGTALARGDSEQAIVRLDKELPRGPWRARLRLSSGLVERTAEATIRLPRAAAKPSTESAGGSRYLFLVAAALLALLAVAASVHLLVRRSA